MPCEGAVGDRRHRLAPRRRVRRSPQLRGARPRTRYRTRPTPVHPRSRASTSSALWRRRDAGSPKRTLRERKSRRRPRPHRAKVRDRRSNRPARRRWPPWHHPRCSSHTGPLRRPSPRASWGAKVCTVRASPLACGPTRVGRSPRSRSGTSPRSDRSRPCAARAAADGRGTPTRPSAVPCGTSPSLHRHRSDGRDGGVDHVDGNPQTA